MEEAEFFEAFARRPEDPHLRVVYADWLEERGDRWRAELVRLWLRTAPWLALPGWHPETEEFHRASGFFDRTWQRRVFDPPVSLASRRDRRWLGALLGGAEERAAMGDDAPPSVLEDAVFGTNLLWGWPSPLLFRLGFAAAKDAIDACGAVTATSDLPRAELLRVIALIEEAAARGASSFEVDFIPARAAALQPPRPSDLAFGIAARLPLSLALMLGPYQATHAEQTRPGAAADVVIASARVHEQLRWATRGLARKHGRKDQAVATARAAAARAEKAERRLEAAEPRLAWKDLPAAERVEHLAELTAWRDHTRRVAAEANARAEALVAACPTPPTLHGELRALLRRIAPELVRWLRAEDEFPPEPLKRNLVEAAVRGRWNHTWRVTYADDGRATSTYVR